MANEKRVPEKAAAAERDAMFKHQTDPKLFFKKPTEDAYEKDDEVI